MDNESFDRRIRDGLLSYEDSTPASVGWNQFSIPTDRTRVIRKWLWGSVIVNVLLLLIVPFLYYQMHQFGERIEGLEATKESTVEPSVIYSDTVYRYVTMPAATNPGQFSRPINQAGNDHLPEGLVEPEQQVISDYDILWHTPRLLATNNLVDPIFPLVLSPTIRMKKPATEQTKISTTNHQMKLSTVAEMERNRFGKSVKWEYGLQLNGGRNLSNNLYHGIGLGSDAFVNMWLNPFWSIQSGLGFSVNHWATNDSTTMQNQWDLYDGSRPANSLIADHAYRTSTISIPLIARYHLPVSDKSRWSLGAGLVSNLSIMQSAQFDLEVPEQEHQEPEYEVEYHHYEESFNKSKAGINNSLYAELVYRRRINRSKFFWSTGLYYQYGLGDTDPIKKRQQLGFMLRFSRSQF